MLLLVLNIILDMLMHLGLGIDQIDVYLVLDKQLRVLLQQNKQLVRMLLVDKLYMLPVLDQALDMVNQHNLLLS